jgi:S1-C subfamily serine protease
MKPNKTAVGITAVALIALSGITAAPSPVQAADNEQAEREARRVESEFRREQELARRNIEGREVAQAQALREQEDAIRRMEATQARIQASSEQLAQQNADQARSYLYSPYPYSMPGRVDRAPGDIVSRMSFAPVSDRLKSYFGTQSGLLVVSAGPEAAFGLQDGDVVISIDGRVPADVEQLTRILRSYKAGERVRLSVQRDRRTVELDTTAPGQHRN